MIATGITAGKVFIALTGILYATQAWYRSSFGPIVDVLQSELHATSGEIGFMNALYCRIHCPSTSCSVRNNRVPLCSPNQRRLNCPLISGTGPLRHRDSSDISGFV